MVRALDPRGARQNGFYPHCKHKIFSQIFKEEKQFHDEEQKCNGDSQGSCFLRSAVEVVLLAILRCSSFKLNYYFVRVVKAPKKLGVFYIATTTDKGAYQQVSPPGLHQPG